MHVMPSIEKARIHRSIWKPTLFFGTYFLLLLGAGIWGLWVMDEFEQVPMPWPTVARQAGLPFPEEMMSEGEQFVFIHDLDLGSVTMCLSPEDMQLFLDLLHETLPPLQLADLQAQLHDGKVVSLVRLELPHFDIVMGAGRGSFSVSSRNRRNDPAGTSIQ